MNDPKIDLDSEAIWHDGRWFQRDELAGAIRAKLEQGDFAVAALSQALEQLHQAASNARVISFRVDAQVADALAAQAQRVNLSVGTLLRHAVAGVLEAEPQPLAVQTTTEPVAPGETVHPLVLRPKTAATPDDESSAAEQSWFRQGGS